MRDLVPDGCAGILIGVRANAARPLEACANAMKDLCPLWLRRNPHWNPRKCGGNSRGLRRCYEGPWSLMAAPESLLESAQVRRDLKRPAPMPCRAFVPYGRAGIVIGIRANAARPLEACANAMKDLCPLRLRRNPYWNPRKCGETSRGLRRCHEGPLALMAAPESLLESAQMRRDL